MKAAAFEYARPSQLEIAMQALAEGAGACKVMSGSQSLGPMLNLRLARPKGVVDLSSLPVLREVTSQTGFVKIGAAVTHAEIEDGVYPQLADHPIRSVAAGIAYRAIRTRGTVGGSLAHADPAADWVVSFTAFGARIHVRSIRGSRVVEASKFMQGAYTTALEFDEVITAIDVPSKTPSMRWGYHKLCRKPGEFAEASAAACINPQGRYTRIVLGAVDGPPVILETLSAEVAARGAEGASKNDIRSAVSSALPDRDQIDVNRFSVCVERALMQAGVLSAKTDLVE